ncbi:MAG: PilZ domain-containing protein [Terracidiphilus sp.]
MKDTSKIKYAPKNGLSAKTASRKEVRCAVRFPLSLPAVLSADNEESKALTRNVSASGVLLEVHDPLEVGQGIDFSIQMPGSVLGAPSDVMVRCHGRVVRCSLSQGQYEAAATIDDYRFAER